MKVVISYKNEILDVKERVKEDYDYKRVVNATFFYVAFIVLVCYNT